MRARISGSYCLFTVDSISTCKVSPGDTITIRSLDCIGAVAQEDAYDLKITVRDSNAIETIIGRIGRAGGKIDSFHTLEPSLEDVFLTVTGKEMRDETSNRNASSDFHDHMDTPKSRVR